MAGHAVAQAITSPHQQVVATLADRFQVDESTVYRQLKAQDRAMRIYDRILPHLGEDFAGAWYDPELESLKIAVANTAHLQRIHRAGAIGHLAAKSLLELEATHQRLIDAATLNEWGLGISSSGVDVQANRIILEVVDGFQDRVEAGLLASGVPLGFVSIEVTSSPISAMLDVHGGSSYKNTNPLESPECSLGFAVEQGGFLTAAHCGLAGDSVTTNSSPAQALGIFAASTRPVQIEWDPDGISVYDNDDQAWISIAPPWVASYKVAPSLYDQPDIIGPSKPLVGQWLCRFGGKTGGPHCGEVLSTSVRLTLGIFDGYPLTIPDAIQTNICADRGDSGGPLLRPSWMKVLPGRSYAVGLLSGGTLPAGCPNAGQVTYYSKVGRALVNFGLTLKTLESSP